jgi:hypothetical protein
VPRAAFRNRIVCGTAKIDEDGASEESSRYPRAVVVVVPLAGWALMPN